MPVLTGSENADTIFGTDGDDTIAGLGGADVIVGGAGNDDLDGHFGDDSIEGGAGDDIVIGDQGRDSLYGGVGNDILAGNLDADFLVAGEGNDFAEGDEGDDTIDAGAGRDTLVGGAGDDILNANDGDDYLVGGDGDDTMSGGTGDDMLDGGAGMDVARYSGSVRDYLVTHGESATTVISISDNTADNVVSVERLQFDDGAIAFDVDGNAGKAYRLYQAAFDREPDLGGLGYQMHDLDIGYSLSQVAANFIASPEFQSKYGEVDNAQFILLLYQHVLHRDPDAQGLQDHLNEIARGYSRADVLTFFSESPENQANVIGEIQNGMVYVF
jgi:serralysin